MKTYQGDRTIDGIVATVNGADLDDYSQVKKFTNAGFEWGFEGAAATQLAFALLYDHTGDAARSEKLAPRFMNAYTANFGNEWEMTSEDLDAVIADLAEKAG
ncbi:MAG: DUF6166 domain-containing protein [Qingshengfaniella sp.]